jgi:hypothetical protein
MSRWQEIIANLLGDLANVSPGGDVRRDVDGLISEAESLAANAEPTDVLETPKRLRKSFEADLRFALSNRLAQENSNPIWREALALLDHPQLRRSRR